MSNAELCSRKNKTGQISDHTMDEQQSNHDWDVVIVGAGPVGGHTANLLVKKVIESYYWKSIMKSVDRFNVLGLLPLMQ